MLLPHLMVTLGGFTAQTPAAPQLALQAVRFYAPSIEQTTVMAFLQVPYVMIDTAGGRIAWETTVQVNDPSGMAIMTESWWSGVPAMYRIPEASSVEPLVFALAEAGKYRISVTVKDSVSGRNASVTTEVEGFAAPPGASDLLVASMMRLTANDTTTYPGEIARGSIRFSTAPGLTLDALRPSLAFMVEAYSSAEAAVHTRLEVKGADGTSVLSLAPFEQTVPAGGGVIHGMVPLEGIPEGDYRLLTTLEVGGSTTVREAKFSVGSLQEAMQREAQRVAATRGLDEAYFGTMPEAQLDRAADVLSLIAPGSELSVYKASGDGALSVGAKRRFLIDFWGKRDESPATAINETRIAFYDKIEIADRDYAEPGLNARPGWKTDRGRIFVKYGKPEEFFPFPAADRAPPFEIWRYSGGRSRYYIFADRYRTGAYHLLRSNDLQENGLPGWVEIIGPEIVMRDIEPLLGVRFCQIQPGNSEDPTARAGMTVCN